MELERWNPILHDLVYTALDVLLMFIVGWLVYRLLRKVINPNVLNQLQAGNISIGLAVVGIFLTIGIGMGLMIGYIFK